MPPASSRRPFGRVLCEAVIIAITIVIIGILTTYAWMRIFPPREHRDGLFFWPMVGPLFVTGFVTYLFREYTGVNRFVCDNTQNGSALR